MTSAVRSLHKLLTRHRELTLSLAWQEIRQRHAGQFFGFFWSFFYPVIFLGVYVFIFGFMFRVRTGEADDSAQRVLFLLSGLIPWLTVTDVLGRSSTTISGNANLVKQVVFPIEVLPVKSVIAALFNQCIFLGLYFVFVPLLGETFAPSALVLLLFALMLQFFAFIGLAYMIAAIAVYIPDIREVIRVFTFLGMFTTPILMRVDQVPETWALFFYANPFSYMIWAFQDAMAGGGGMAQPWVWGVYVLLSVGTFIIGHVLFNRLRIMFGNVL